MSGQAAVAQEWFISTAKNTFLAEVLTVEMAGRAVMLYSAWCQPLTPYRVSGLSINL
jgi:hypothetical protein